ncbi:MAG TPA: heparan-alpha-glucosaminide N-acetyltransferase domain-containing protein [Patescibacteria group bacterium]|nr:heparan-alpha-glucosaminide N-acetyltransferase domain-containing protein [Patescibacteria group bacterium]
METAENLISPVPSQTRAAAFTPIVRPRLESVDLLRGLIMVLMALDHTRDFFSNVKFDPLDLTQTNPALFLTRWFTHYCAPNFIFLAGIGASLAARRGKPKKELSWFLFSRGLWLAFLEVTWVYCLGWAFNFDLRNTGAAILWAIGWSMVVLSVLIWLPTAVIAAFGVGMIVLHNAFDWVQPQHLGAFGWLITVLHVPGPIYEAPGWHLRIGYVLVPWMGVMAAGYAFGRVYSWQAERRQRFTFGLGLAITIAFLVIRGINGYGNPKPWMPQDRFLYTIFSFVDCHKYPPSLDYVLMTIGPALMILAFLERNSPKILRPFLVFGRVPLFYYLLHLPLLHGMAIVVAFIRHGRADWLFQSPFSGVQPPPEAGFGLLGVYLFWITAILILYPICRWFSELKLRKRDWWLSYL